MQKSKRLIRHGQPSLAQLFGVKWGRFSRFFDTKPIFLSFVVNSLATARFHGIEESELSGPTHSRPV